MSTPAQTPLPPALPPDAYQSVLADVVAFQADCEHRYKFNSRWDNWLNAAGILLSVAIIAAGTYDASKLSALLGGLVAAIVTAQRAFPFGPRAQFYRVLIGQTTNLITDMKTGVALSAAVTTLKALRLDFAQQLPRGSSTRDAASGGNPDPNAPNQPQQ